MSKPRTSNQKRRVALAGAIAALEMELQHPDTPRVMPESAVKDGLQELKELRGWLDTMRQGPRVKLTDEQKADIRQFYYHGTPKPWTVRALSRTFKVSAATIHKVLNEHGADMG